MSLRVTHRRWFVLALALGPCVGLYLALPWLEKPLGGRGASVLLELADTWVFLSILLLVLSVADPQPDLRS